MKFDLRDSFEDRDYTPSACLAWALRDHQTVWFAVSLALRIPSPNDTDLIVNLGGFTDPTGTVNLIRFQGNPHFNDERLVAYEIGYRAALADRLTFDVATYINHYHNLGTTEPSPPFFEATPAPPYLVLPFTNQNFMSGETHGIEFAVNWKVTNRWTLSPGYAFEALHMHPDAASNDIVTPLFVERGSPRHSAQLRSHFDWRRGLAWDTSAYFVDRLSNQGPSTQEVIPAYTRLDTGLTWKLREGFSLAVGGQNLLRDHHTEFQ